MIFAGESNQIADRILALHASLGHSSHVLQMDVGGLAHGTLLRAIELLDTEVAPPNPRGGQPVMTTTGHRCHRLRRRRPEPFSLSA